MPDRKRSTCISRLLIGIAAIIILFGAAYFLFVTRSQAATVTQPMPFPHQTMVQAGVDCVFCHNTAMKSPAANIPSVQRCMGCHKVIATNTPNIQILKGYWDRQEPIPWKRVYTLPRFVYFSHEVHVQAAGLNCERCHGDVGHMMEAQPVVKMNMGWCLSCHDQQPNAAQLKDCVVCHQ